MKFSDITQLIPPGHYQIDVPLSHIQSCLKSYEEDFGLELNPDFQRGHIWTYEQQQSYVEFLLSGGRSAKIIYFNCIGWRLDPQGPIQCVDGLQRLTAVCRFLDDDLGIFGGHRLSDFEDKIPFDIGLQFNINELPTRKDVLKWYLQMNSGGTPHTTGELDRVYHLLMEASD